MPAPHPALRPVLQPVFQPVLQPALQPAAFRPDFQNAITDFQSPKRTCTIATSRNTNPIKLSNKFQVLQQTEDRSWQPDIVTSRTTNVPQQQQQQIRQQQQQQQIRATQNCKSPRPFINQQPENESATCKGRPWSVSLL